MSEDSTISIPEAKALLEKWKRDWPNVNEYYEKMKRLAGTEPNPCAEIVLGPSEPCVLPMPEPQEKPMTKLRIFVADHFSLDMIKEAGGLEQGRISKGEAVLFAHMADYELCSLIKDERMASLLSDLLRVRLEVDSREAKSFIGAGEIVIFVEELDKGLQFWRLDVLKETRAIGSQKKAWSW